MSHPKYRILISYSEWEKTFFAVAVNGPTHKGIGASYQEALQDLEKALAANSEPPAKAVADDLFDMWLKDTRLGPQARTMRMLKYRYGDHTIDYFCRKFGKGHNKTAFVFAMNGNGTRELRALVAHAVGIPPSQLWPERAFTTRRRDDEAYFKVNAQPCSEADDAGRGGMANGQQSSGACA